MFNTYRDLYRGIKNSLLVELITFSVLFILHLGECMSRAQVCDDRLTRPDFLSWSRSAVFRWLAIRWFFQSRTVCHPAKRLAPYSYDSTCRLGRATLAFAWLSTITLMLLLAFLLTWILLHRRRRLEISILRTNIKEFLIDGDTSLRASGTGMSAIPASTTGGARVSEASVAVTESTAPEAARV